MVKKTKILKEETKKVTCLSCGKEVTVELIPYGEGHIGNCPKCGKLAYNGK